MPETGVKKAPVRRSSENMTAFDRDLIKASIHKVIVGLWFSPEFQDNPEFTCTVLQVDRYFVKVKHEPVGKEIDSGIVWIAKSKIVGVRADV